MKKFAHINATPVGVSQSHNFPKMKVLKMGKWKGEK